jgi:hypothetical protein
MQTNPRSEPVENIFPHVAAAAAAYGDPGAKYTTFLQTHESNYKSDRFWLYDQTRALKMAPATRKKREVYNKPRYRRSERWVKRDKADTSNPSDDGVTGDVGAQQNTTIASGFDCPAAFHNVNEVELDNGLFVTCDQLKSFYVFADSDQNQNA